MGKFTDKQDIDSIYATVKTIFESIDNEAGEPMVDQETCEEQQISDHENLQEISEGVRFNATTDAATSSLIQTPRNERTWGTSQNSQHEDVVDDTPQPVFGNFAGKPLRGTPHPGQGGTVSLEHNDCSDTMGSADGHSESDDEEYISKKMPDHDNNDCDVFSSSTHNTPRNRRKSTVSRRKKEISKKVRVGVRVDGDSEETAGSRVTVLTPRKARQNERESLGVTEIITPVRRSRRLFDESMYAPTQAEAHEIMENLDKPYEINSNDSARDIDDKENEQSLYPASGLMKQAAGRQGEKISKLLENYGYAYAPNKMLDPVTLPKSGKKHK
ncbi:hypothetical protein BJ742DRAFT_16314 [Cladochytrium replicatum]|nr:hypothetical protein BJ742DRAFT_16314 [Cladochytrium replicatum]